MKKRLLSALLALCMALALLPGTAHTEEWTQPEPTQTVSGNVLASELQDGARVALAGDTVLTLDTDKSVEWIDGGGYYNLTIEGSAAFTIYWVILD